MSKNPSDKNRVPADEDEQKQSARKTDGDRAGELGENRRPGESMARKQQGQKFVSDEDIVKNRRTA
jgi:hypothetical protein